jgi:mRNA interferase YafQ
MRKIRRIAQFKQDYKREKRGQHKLTLDNELTMTIKLLVIDGELPISMHDDTIIGNLKDSRDCHIKPYLLLIYRKTKDNILELIRLGFHGKLGF